MSQQTNNLVHNIVNNSKKNGVAKLILQNQSFDGKHVEHNNRKLVSFGSYSYLGLEIDDRLKTASIEAIQKYGIQYPSSRIYSSLPIYQELMDKMEKIFNNPVVLTTSLSLGHMGVMPIVMSREDLVILDQHVHSSVQDAAQRLKANGVKVMVVRHNDMVDLERKIINHQHNYRKIWYAIDSIYSMYGDTAPILQIEELLNRYKSFHVYADDAHGISSYGLNGAGWILSKIDLHPKMVLSTGMAKAFGTMGGVFIIPDRELYERVDNCTGSLIFSGPHPIPIIAASIASASIHLSTEIIERQLQLHDKIAYCARKLKEYHIPDISDPTTPIFFIAIGKLNAGYRLVNALKEKGFLTNIAAFPAVSETCTGIRFTITLHHNKEDIDGIADALRIVYPQVLEEEEMTVRQLRHAFRKVARFPEKVVGERVAEQVKTSDFTIKKGKSILEFSREEWNQVMEVTDLFDYETVLTMQTVMKDNEEAFNNWQFRFIFIYDQQGKLVLATMFTIALVKDDMLSHSGVSEDIEKERALNPLALCSKVALMGTPFSEGRQVYMNDSHQYLNKGIEQLLNQIHQWQEEDDFGTIFLRDFSNAKQLNERLTGHGFLKITMPKGHQIQKIHLQTEPDYLLTLDKKKRKYVKKRAINKASLFDVRVIACQEKTDLQRHYQLHRNVHDRAFELNTFPITYALFCQLAHTPFWEILEIHYDDKLVAMMLSHVKSSSYSPVLVGLDYDFKDLDIYSQIIWQVVKRAKQLHKSDINLGYTASQNKRKFGAQTQERHGFVLSNDNFNQLQIAMYQEEIR